MLINRSFSLLLNAGRAKSSFVLLPDFFRKAPGGFAMFLRGLAIWIALLVLAVVNGALRESVLELRMGEQLAHVVSTIILSGAIFIAALFTILWIGAQNAYEAFLVGILWVLLTVAFEFFAGHYLFGSSWQSLIADYNLFRGRIWLLVLLTNLLAPALAFYARAH
jgi:hypothetical protein